MRMGRIGTAVTLTLALLLGALAAVAGYKVTLLAQELLYYLKAAAPTTVCIIAMWRFSRRLRLPDRPSPNGSLCPMERRPNALFIFALTALSCWWRALLVERCSRLI